MITKQELETIRAKAPLLSEGAISPFQVSNMSKREKAEREKNIQIRYNTEYQLKKENMTEREKEQEKQENILIEMGNLKSMILRNVGNMDYLKLLPAFKSNRMNNTRKSVLIYEAENQEFKIKIKELEGRYKR